MLTLTLYDKASMREAMSSRARAVALQWLGPLVVPMGKATFCTSPEPKLLYQSTPNFERLIISVR